MSQTQERYCHSKTTKCLFKQDFGLGTETNIKHKSKEISPRDGDMAKSILEMESG